MNKFIENASRNLLENSNETLNYKKAIEEWYFTYEVLDNNENFDISEIRPSCELCEHEDLRWQFTIKNIINNNQLRVGSTCIKQFNIVLIDKHGKRVYGKERDLSLINVINEKRKEAEYNNVLESLRDLWQKDKKTNWSKYIERCGKQWKEKKSLEPTNLAFVIYRFKENNIKYEKLELKINLRNEKYKNQILNMEKWKYLLIRPYLHKKTEEYDKHFNNK